MGAALNDASREQGIADALAALVGAIGAKAFPARFLAAMQALVPVELCSVFLREGNDTVSLLFAEGSHPALFDFPARASLDYARTYWRSDRQLLRIFASGCGGPVVVRKSAEDIADPAWRSACYERADVAERLSIVLPGDPMLVANGYRTAAADPFTGESVARLERYAGLLMAAVDRHRHLAAPSAHMLDEAALVQSLMRLRYGLSTREAEISAAMMLGETQDEIALRKRLSHGSVVTYRRRAYGKLGVSNRRDLIRLHRRLAAGESMPPSPAEEDAARWQ